MQQRNQHPPLSGIASTGQALRLEGVTHRYGAAIAVDNIHLDVPVASLSLC